MNDWNLWLSSNETRTAISFLKEVTEELKDLIVDGSHIQEKRTDKIALDYTYSLGQLDGMRTLLGMLENIKEELSEDERE